MAEILYQGTCGEHLTWTFNTDGLLTVSGTGPMENYDLSVPGWRGGTYATLPNIRDNILAVVIEEGVTTVGNYAFDLSRGLVSVTIPNSVATIGKYGFSGCPALTSLTIGSGVTDIANSAFEDCDALQDIYYAGTAQQWAAVRIAENNEPLTAASLHYGMYTVTFDSNGGSTVENRTVTSGSACEKPTDPVKTDYAFGGWYLNGVKYNFTTPVTSDITLTAQWTENQTPTPDPTPDIRPEAGHPCEIIHAVPGSPIPLGHQGEKYARRIVFDISRWTATYGDGNAVLLHQRQLDTLPYPVTITTDGDSVIWDVTAADTDQPCHYGKAELRYYQDGVLVKSDIWQTEVIPALPPEPGDAPEAGADWFEDLSSLMRQATETARGITESTNQAAGYAQQAATAAANADTAQTAAAASATAAETARQNVAGLEVSVNTLNPGSDATVTQGTTASGNIKLTFGIPKGAKGDTGPAGANAKINGHDTITIQHGDNVTIAWNGSTATISATGSVTGVKGDAENAYRTGNINLTPANLGLGNVNNTADLDKPVSNATQAAIDAKVDKETGKGLSTNDYTTAEKTKLEGIAAGATANTGTITGITMNGTSKGTSGVVDLGTVITQHQDISGKQDKLPVTGAANRGVYVSAAGVVTAMTHTLEADVPSNAVFTDTTYDAADTAPVIDGTAAVGTSAKYARADHVHPTDTSRAAQADLESAQATITQQAAEIQRLRQLVNGIDASIYLSAGPGNPVSVSDAFADAPLRAFTVDLPVIQAGSGPPSPDNVRPISGYTAFTVKRYGQSEEDNLLSVPFSFDSVDVTGQNEPGVVYGGTLDVLTGTLTVSWKTRDLTSLTWGITIRSTNHYHHGANLSGFSPASDQSKILWSHYKNVVTGFSGLPNLTARKPNQAYFEIRDDRFDNNDDWLAYVQAQSDAGTPLQLSVPLATPLTFQLSPAQIAALPGVNTFSATAGDVSVTYRVDPTITGGT